MDAPVEKKSTSDLSPLPMASRHGEECGWKPHAAPAFGFRSHLILSVKYLRTTFSLDFRAK
jgi:hypothetical protein